MKKFSIFPLSIIILLFALCPLFLAVSTFAQCPYPNVPSGGCCDYGEHTGNTYYIPHSPDCYGKCHTENYSGDFPYGDECKYCNSNVCKRNDGQGGCAGFCNWACCYYGPGPATCKPEEWLCKTEDTVLPDVLCCWWHCLPKEILPPHLCPTNQDLGQKDGTGKTGADRHYYYFDYDLEKIIEVPPVLPD